MVHYVERLEATHEKKVVYIGNRIGDQYLLVNSHWDVDVPRPRQPHEAVDLVPRILAVFVPDSEHQVQEALAVRTHRRFADP